MFILNVKRAMKDKLSSYKGESDLNWDNLDQLAYSYFCNKFGGHYTPYPNRSNQSEDFINFVDKYEDESYTDTTVEEAPAKSNGTDLKQFIPDRKPIPQELPVPEKIAMNKVINENANVKSPSDAPPATPPNAEPVPEPEAEVKEPSIEADKPENVEEPARDESKELPAAPEPKVAKAPELKSKADKLSSMKIKVR